MTLPQLLREAPKRNQAILASSKSCGDKEIDAQLLAETREEVRLGWARGPFSSLPEGYVWCHGDFRWCKEQRPG